MSYNIWRYMYYSPQYCPQLLVTAFAWRFQRNKSLNYSISPCMLMFSIKLRKVLKIQKWNIFEKEKKCRHYVNRKRSVQFGGIDQCSGFLEDSFNGRRTLYNLP